MHFRAGRAKRIVRTDELGRTMLSTMSRGHAAARDGLPARLGADVKNENVPYVPGMSGVPMPLNSRVAEPDGGKFAGIRMIVVRTPCCSSASQNGWPSRNRVDASACERQLPAADREVVRRRLRPCRRQIRNHRCRVAMDEIEDPVSAGIQSGDDAGPGDRTLRWDRRAERRERAGRRDSGEVRHAALRHQIARDP